MKTLAACAILSLVTVEAVALWRSGQLSASLALTLASGSLLVVALLCGLNGAPTPLLLGVLALAGVAHALDLRARWR